MTNLYMKSNELLERAKKVTPLGAQTYSKCYRYFCEGYAPAFLERGNGSHVWDVDGNEFVDFICALGPVTVGYNDKRINAAIMRQLEKGISFSQSTQVELELAEKIVDIIPCAEMVRFVKNGSDATSAAVRLARAYTGRDIIAICGYHGMQDWYIGSTPNNMGVPKSVCELSVTFEYNNLDSLRKLFDSYNDKIAAVILEPIQADGPIEGYLNDLKNLAHEHGALVIFDEVVSGFRYALGGASELYGVSPDLVAIGKGMGNGMPISAVASRKDIMEQIGTKGVFISTTFGGEALSLAGALETIRILEQPGVYDKIWNDGKMMLDGLTKCIEKYELKNIVELYGLPPHGGVVFNGCGSLDYLDINSVYQQIMIKNGILTIGVNNFSTSHTESDVLAFLEAADEALKYIKQAVTQNSLEGILEGGKVDPIFKRNAR